MIMESWKRVSVDSNQMVDVNDAGPLAFEGRVFGHYEVPDHEIAVIKMQGYSFQDEGFLDMEGNPVFLRQPDPTYNSMFKDVQKRLSRLINACRFLLPSLMRRAA